MQGKISQYAVLVQPHRADRLNRRRQLREPWLTLARPLRSQERPWLSQELRECPPWPGSGGSERTAPI